MSTLIATITANPDYSLLNMRGYEGLNFSFVIPNKLAGMSYPFKDDTTIILRFLRDHNIGAIVSLTEYPLNQQPVLNQAGFDYLHIPIVDYEAPTFDQAEQFVAYVNQRLTMEPQQGVVAHCIAGCGRTGTMLASYLITTGLNAADAITEIRRLRPCSVQSPQQDVFLYHFADWWQFIHSQLQHTPSSR